MSDIEPVAEAGAAKPKFNLPRPTENQTLTVFTTSGPVPQITGYRLVDNQTSEVVSVGGEEVEGGAALKVDLSQFDGAAYLVKNFEALKAEAKASLQPAGIRQYRLFYKRGNSAKFGTLRPSPEYANLYDRPEINEAIEYMRTRPHVDGVAVLIGDERYNIDAFTQAAIAPNAFVFVEPSVVEAVAKYADETNAELSA